VSIIGLTGLLKIELPSHDILLCDGAFFTLGADTYRSKDGVFGTIESVEAIEEGVGDTVPAVVLTMLPPSTSAVVDISQPGNQTSRVTFRIAEYDTETMVITSSDVLFLGQVDQTVLTLGRTSRKLAISVVSLAERLFEGNIGNSLNPTFHKYVWSGETGHDNATGLSIPVAWGTEKSGDSISGATSTTKQKKHKKARGLGGT
jgi:hypothetical protein